MLGAPFQMIGNIAGGMINDSMLSSGMDQAGKKYGMGIDYLKQGNAQQRGDFQPYMQAGQQGLGRYQGMLDQGNQAAMPQQSGAFSFDQWQDPSAQWSMDQSNKAIQASMIAKGAAGGGMGKALQANAANLAGQQYQNAFQRYLAQNQQDFGQQQQQFANQTDNWKTRLGGYGNLAQAGQQAAGTSGQLGLGYGQGVMSGYQNWGNQIKDNYQQRGAVTGVVNKGAGQDLGSMDKLLGG